MTARIVCAQPNRRHAPSANTTYISTPQTSGEKRHLERILDRRRRSLSGRCAAHPRPAPRGHGPRSAAALVQAHLRTVSTPSPRWRSVASARGAKRDCRRDLGHLRPGVRTSGGSGHCPRTSDSRPPSVRCFQSGRDRRSLHQGNRSRQAEVTTVAQRSAGIAIRRITEAGQVTPSAAPFRLIAQAQLRRPAPRLSGRHRRGAPRPAAQSTDEPQSSPSTETADAFHSGGEAPRAVGGSHRKPPTVLCSVTAGSRHPSYPASIARSPSAGPPADGC